MSVGSSQLRTIGPWPAGINNLSDEASMPRNQAGALPFLREATNVDLDPTGWPSRRLGYARVITGTRTHSAWSNPYFPWGVYVDAGTMHAVTPGLATNTTLATGLAAGLPVSYCRINGSAVWSNGTQRGQIDANLGLSDWACPSPNGQPTAVLGSGALDPGSYQIAVTFFDSHGRESGASLAVALDVPAAGAIVLTNIPQPLSSTLVPLIRIYATGGNDRDLKAVVTLPTGTTSYTIAQRPEGKPLETQFLQPMPAGQIVRSGNGRQYVARNSEILFSPSFRYGLYHPGKHRVGFSGRVDMMEFVGDGTDGAGLFVADSARTYFLAGGDPAQWKQTIASPYGAVPGVSAMIPGNVFGLDNTLEVPVWLSRNGYICAGLPGGQINIMKQGEAVIDQGDSGAMLFREQDGQRQIIAAVKGAQPQALAISDQMTVREYRHDA